MIFTRIFFLTTVAPARGQALTPKTEVSKKKVHWHKYVNHQYGFSFWYPDTYKPVPVQQLRPELAQYFPSLRFLVSLKERDDSDDDSGVEIGVTIDEQPFHVGPRGNADEIQSVPIGRHVFYPYLTGSMGTEFVDNYDMNLRGKTLSFYFLPGGLSAPFTMMPPFESKMLKAFRTF